MLQTETVGYYIEKLPWWIRKPIFGTLRSIVYAFRKDTYICLDDVSYVDQELALRCQKLWKEINEFYRSYRRDVIGTFTIGYGQSYIGKVRHQKLEAWSMYGVDLNISEYVQALKSLHNYVLQEKKKLANTEARRLSGVNEARATLNLPSKETGQLSLAEGDSK